MTKNNIIFWESEGGNELKFVDSKQMLKNANKTKKIKKIWSKKQSMKWEREKVKFKKWI